MMSTKLQDGDNKLQDDYKWMQKALLQAKKAEALGEVPVGAIVVLNNQVIGEGFNQSIHNSDPTAHAEIVALRDAATKVKNYRLIGATLYVTLEPCTMCTGALVHSRIQRLVYGTKEPKAGVVSSQAELLDAPYLNYRVAFTGGVCEQQCSELISEFFLRRREDKKNKRD